jgi:hypothetical protein
MDIVQNVIENLQNRGLLGPMRATSGDNAMFDCPFRENHNWKTHRKAHFGIRIVPSTGKPAGVWHCFYCHASGKDILSLWTRLTGQSFKEAKKELSSYEVIEETLIREIKSLDEKINNRPVCLTDWPPTVPIEDSSVAMEYLLGRGITQDIWRRAGLEWFGGETMPPRQGNEKSSVKGNRVIFPIEFEGRRVGYSARAVGYETKIKYYRPVSNVNVMLYDPVHLLSGKDWSRVFVVEGEMDCLACIREGLPAVSTFGSSLSKWQAQALTRFHDVCFLYDQDKAGIDGIKRAVTKYGGILRWRAFWLPRGKDAASMPPGWGKTILAMTSQKPDHSIISLEKAIKEV